MKRLVAIVVAASVLAGSSAWIGLRSGVFGYQQPAAIATEKAPEKAPAAKGFWLNTKTNVRHNQSCRWYQNTTAGRACKADEGRACHKCGG